MNQSEFLAKYNITEDAFTATGLDWNELLNIKTNFESQFQLYDDAGANLVRILLKIPSVHSVKYRIKDGEHLIEKIIRKKRERPKEIITEANYQNMIHDLIGIRILHLFKSDWLLIHQALGETFKFIQRPEANIREGDDRNLYKSTGCTVKIHKAGYRSVHYIIGTEPTRKRFLGEVQVRTIFEEAWSEVDHHIRYPYFTDNDLINRYLQIFNRLAGGADEMGDYVRFLRDETLLKEQLITSQKEEIEKLKEKVNTSNLQDVDKRAISENLDAIKSLSMYRTFTGDTVTEALKMTDLERQNLLYSLKGISTDTTTGIFQKETLRALQSKLDELNNVTINKLKLMADHAKKEKSAKDTD